MYHGFTSTSFVLRGAGGDDLGHGLVLSGVCRVLVRDASGVGPNNLALVPRLDRLRAGDGLVVAFVHRLLDRL